MTVSASTKSRPERKGANMPDETIQARVFRFDPSVDREPRYDTFDVPLVHGMSAMDVLDHIYRHLDSSLAYYDHAACSLGICGRCLGKINGRPGLLCQTAVDGDVTIEPPLKSEVVKDLVFERPDQEN